MSTNINSTENTLNQFSIGFKTFAKEELEKEFRQLDYSLDPDTTYINIPHNTEILSETLTIALLKKSTGKETLLDDDLLTGLYSNPMSSQEEQQIKEVDFASVKRCIDILSTTLIDSYRTHLTNFWTKNNFSIPKELQDDTENTFLNNLLHRFAIVDRADQINTSYPSLRQSITFYLIEKLKSLCTKDIDPHKVHINIFSENDNLLYSFNLIEFTLKCFSSHFRSLYLLANESPLIQITSDQSISDLKIYDILQENSITNIIITHKRKVDAFWQKHSENYQILAKFSYLKALFTQQNGEYRLSRNSLNMAFQALGFTLDQLRTIIESNQIEFDQIPLEILTDQLAPNDVEISSFCFNGQVASDILQIRNRTDNSLLLYIPSYTHSFVEAQTEELLANWIFKQAEQQEQRSLLGTHFPLSSRLYSNKLDFFLYEDYIKPPFSNPITTETDIFSFLVENQKMRISADLSTDGPVVCSIPFLSPSSEYTAFFSNPTNDKSVSCTGPFPNHETIDIAFSNPIYQAIASLSTLLPDTYTTFNSLFKLFPQPHKTASTFMRAAIQEKWGINLDPDKTFIGYFLPLDKPIVFEPGETIESRRISKKRTQTLTEAALSNYRMGFTPFSSTTIIFKDPSGSGLYPPAKEQIVKILPKDIEEIIKNADLDTLHKNKLSAFWNTQADQVRRFIKHRYLQQALEAHQNKRLSEQDLKIILEVAIHSLALEENASITAPFSVQIKIVTIMRYQSSNIFVLQKLGQERVILYIPGSQKAFFSFPSCKLCLLFLQEKAHKDTKWQELLISHFPIDDQNAVLEYLKLGSFSTTYTMTGKAYFFHSLETKTIESNLFSAIQKNLQESSFKNANKSIISDKDLLLKRIRDIVRSIGIALFVPSFAFPVLNWFALAALSTEIAVNLYVAKNGDTVNERYQAAIDAGLNSIGILISAFLSFRSLKLSKSYKAITRNTALRVPQTFQSKNPISLENYFGTQNSLQVWNISASNPLYSYLDVKAWFLEENFLLFTGKTRQADHLIISSHGGYFPGAGNVPVPNGTELIVLGPHGWEITDPKTSNVAKQIVSTYGVINENTTLPTQTAFNPYIFTNTTGIYPKRIDIKLLSGTDIPGHIRNYTLSKYQKFGLGNESYLDIAQVVNRSRNPLPVMDEVGLQPIDVLTIRNRLGTLTNLKDVFQALQNQGIHYKRITLEFCRSNILLSALNLAPIYTPSII